MPFVLTCFKSCRKLIGNLNLKDCMTLSQAAARALQTHVRTVTRRRNFLVWFEDSVQSRDAGLQPPSMQTPPALKNLLLKFSPARHQVVHGSSIPYIQRIMPRLLSMGVCLVKHSPTALHTTRFVTKNEENNFFSKAHAQYRRQFPWVTNAEYSRLIQNADNRRHARPGKRSRRA